MIFVIDMIVIDITQITKLQGGGQHSEKKEEALTSPLATGDTAHSLFDTKEGGSATPPPRPLPLCYPLSRHTTPCAGHISGIASYRAVLKEPEI